MRIYILTKRKCPVIPAALTAHHTPTWEVMHWNTFINTAFSADLYLLLWEFTCLLRSNQILSLNMTMWGRLLHYAPHEGIISQNSFFLQDMCLGRWVTAALHRCQCGSVQTRPFSVQVEPVFSILCLTTDPIHQGHEKRKKSVTSARSPRNTSAQLRDR